MGATYTIEKGYLLLILDNTIIDKVPLGNTVPLRKEEIRLIVNKRIRTFREDVKKLKQLKRFVQEF